MKLLFKAVGWLLFVLFVLAIYPAACFVLQDAADSNTTLPAPALAVFSIALYCAAFIVLALTLFTLLRALFPEAKAEPERRLMALAITALLVPATVSSIASAFVSAFDSLFSGLGFMLEHPALRKLDGGNANMSVNESSTALLGLFQILGNYCSRAISSLLRPSNMKDVVMAFAIWLCCYAFIGSSPVPGDATGPSRFQRMTAWLRALAPANRYNLFLILIFIFGCYLSIAAIVAIPSLHQQQSNDGTLTRDRMQSELQRFTLPKDQFQKLFPQDYRLAIDPLAKLNTFLTNANPEILTVVTQAEAKIIVQNSWKSLLAEATAFLQNGSEFPADRIRNWQKARQDFEQLEANLTARALSAYDLDTIGPMITQERVLYFQNVVTWFRENMEQAKRIVQGNMQTLDDLDADLQRSSAYILNRLESERDNLTRIADRDLNILTMRAGFLLGIPPDYRGRNSYGMDLTSIAISDPRPPEPGSYAGPFAFIARWLLRTRSFSLSLITGMIGFGLLGSSIASFIRSDIKISGSGSGRVVIRIVVQGLSAAMVIFLAVEGGLSVFAAGDKEPNGYILCFACLVGSVFSEHVWQWARIQLVKKLPTGHAPEEPIGVEDQHEDKKHSTDAKDKRRDQE